MLLQLEEISKVYQDGERQLPVLLGFNLSLGQGEFVGIEGPSGSGKSTLLNILGLVLQPSSGTYEFEGHSLLELGDAEQREMRRSKISFVFQQFCLLSGLSALENVMLTGLLSGMARVDAQVKARELLERCGLLGRSQHLPATLSGGERQRVALCRALIHQPKLILADEPTGSLDLESADQVLLMLSQAVASGISVVMASHSQRALNVCHRVVQLRAHAHSVHL